MINVSKQTYSLKALLQEKEKLLLHILNPLFSLGIEPATEEWGKLLFKELSWIARFGNEHDLLQSPLLKSGANEKGTDECSAEHSVLSQTRSRKTGDMLLTTVSPSQFPWWHENKLHSFIASKELGAALHKLPFLSVAVKEDARRLFHWIQRARHSSFHFLYKLRGYIKLPVS